MNTQEYIQSICNEILKELEIFDIFINVQKSITNEIGIYDYKLNMCEGSSNSGRVLKDYYISQHFIDKTSDIALREAIREHIIDFNKKLKLNRIYGYYGGRGHSLNRIFMDEFAFPPKKPGIKNVIFHNPATIVEWSDGTKTVVKCQDGDIYDQEKGLALCVAKKFLGTNKSKSNFNDIFAKWLSGGDK